MDVTRSGVNLRRVSEHRSETAPTQWFRLVVCDTPLTMWPRVLRQDLRTALHKRNKKDYDKSEFYFRRCEYRHPYTKNLDNSSQSERGRLQRRFRRPNSIRSHI